MESFVSRHVSPTFVEYGCPTEPITDVYSYNFPDDRRLIKILGKH